MKVIETANKVRCERCSALFEINKSDIGHTHSNRGNTHDFVICPCCSFHIRLSSEVFVKDTNKVIGKRI